MDSLAQLAATLFVLSMISERVVSFIKLTFSGWGFLGNLKVKSNDVDAETSRSRRILQVNLFIGFLVALSIRADLVEIFKQIQDPKAGIGWDQGWPQSFPEVLRIILGCFLTGCFLSLGSKFWHDLLDLLLAVKQIKQERAGLFDQISATGVFGQLNPDAKAQQIRTAIDQHAVEWINGFSNVIGCSPGVRVKDGVETGEHVIQFRVADKVADPGAIAVPIPSSIILSNGMAIPTDVVIGSPAIACWKNPGNHLSPVKMGTSISRRELANTGTIGIRVIKKVGDKVVPCLLTCFHVVFPDRIKADGSDVVVPFDPNAQQPMCLIPGNDTAVSPQALIGHAIQGILDGYTDAALVQVDSMTLSELDGCTMPAKPFDYWKSESKKMEVLFVGAMSSKLEKFTWIPDSAESITYDNGSPQLVTKTIKNLITLIGEPPAEGGDSGAIVVTKSGEVMGMVIASDRKSMTWVKPLHGLDTKLDFQFPKQ